MTATQLVVALLAYGCAFIGVVLLARARTRRIVGALLGGAVAGTLLLAMAYVGTRQGWWQVPAPSTTGLRLLLYAATSISLAPIYPVTWRLSRRFGRRGLGACLVFAAVVGPARDWLVSALYPEWITLAPGPVPIAAVSVTYVGIVGLGHAVMRVLAGPAASDRLAARGRPAV